MKSSKISPTLANHLANAPGGDVELIVELQPIPPSQIEAGSRAERIAALREAFERRAVPVEAAIQSVGGEVLGGVWLSQILRARVPVATVEKLTSLDEVSLLDLPRALVSGIG